MTDPLVIRSVEFLGGMATAGGWRPPGSLPAIALSGRSNVGKSSLLNALVRRKSLARASKTPGKTREINFYEVNGAFVLADLPGYGYARLSKEARAAWRPLVEGYLGQSAELRGVVQLIDVRHAPSGEDVEMMEYLAELGAPTIVALTKADKLRRADVAKRAATLAGELGVDEAQVIPFSTVTGAGRDELAEAIVELVRKPAWRTV